MRHQNAAWRPWCVIITTLITFSTISGSFTCPFITPVFRACNVLYYHHCTTFILTLPVIYRIDQHDVRLRVWILWLEKLAQQWRELETDERLNAVCWNGPYYGSHKRNILRCYFWFFVISFYILYLPCFFVHGRRIIVYVCLSG